MRVSFDGSNKTFGNPAVGQLSLHSSTDAVLPNRIPCFTVTTQIPVTQTPAPGIRSPTQWMKTDTVAEYKGVMPFGFGADVGGIPNNSPLSSMSGWATSNSNYSGIATDNYHRWSGPSSTDTSVITNTPNHKYRYTIPTTGYWHFTYGYIAGASTAEGHVQSSSICINGNAALAGVYGDPGARMALMNHSLTWNAIMAGIILKCYAGDYVDVRFRTGENNAYYWGPDCNHFNGKLLSRF